MQVYDKIIITLAVPQNVGNRVHLHGWPYFCSLCPKLIKYKKFMQKDLIIALNAINLKKNFSKKIESLFF